MNEFLDSHKDDHLIATKSVGMSPIGLGASGAGSILRQARVLANPSSVTVAFRELQSKAKILEDGMQLLHVESTNIRHKLVELESTQKNRDTNRSSAKLKASEHLFHIREASNKLRLEMAELDTRIVLEDNETRSTQMHITSNRRAFASLEDDLIQLRATVTGMAGRNEMLQKEFDASEAKCEEMREESERFPIANNRAYTKLKEAVEKTSEETARLRFEMDQDRIRFETVSRYMDMMTEVNDEISDTILAKEEAKSRVLRLSGRLHLPTQGGRAVDRDISPGYEREALMPSLRSAGVGAEMAAASSSNTSRYLQQEPASPSQNIADLSKRAKQLSEELGVEVQSNSTSANYTSKENPDAVSFNDVMKIISARAAQHVFKSQQERAKDVARDMTRLASGGNVFRKTFKASESRGVSHQTSKKASKKASGMASGRTPCSKRPKPAASPAVDDDVIVGSLNKERKPTRMKLRNSVLQQKSALRTNSGVRNLYSKTR